MLEIKNLTRFLRDNKLIPKLIRVLLEFQNMEHLKIEMNQLNVPQEGFYFEQSLERGIPFKKSHSSDNTDQPISNVLGLIKLKKLILEFHRMNLDISKCYKILEELKIKGEFEFNHILDVVLENYFDQKFLSQENKNEDLEIRKKVFDNMFDNSDPDILPNQTLPFKRHYSSSILSTSYHQMLDYHIVAEKSPQREKTEESNEKIELKVINVELEEKKEDACQLCDICMSEKPLSLFILNLEDHPFCQQCIFSYLKEVILTPKILDIKCPCNKRCSLNFDENFICKLLSNDIDLYNKYLKFKKIHFYNQDPNGMWCIKPTCENFIKNGSKKRKITCVECKTEMCFICKNAWHGRRTCEESLDMQLLNYRKNIPVKKCPKCKSNIEKNLGCNHMTCSRCHHQFCWLCLKQYTADHFASDNFFGCPGLQNVENPNFKIYMGIYCRRMAKFLNYFCYFLLIILCPLILILGTLILPAYAVYRSDRLEKKSKKQTIIIYIFIILVSIVISPVTLILEICPGSYLLYKEMKVYGMRWS